MNSMGWFQLAVFIAALVAVTKPLGLYLGRVLDPGGKTFLDPAPGPVERFIYRVLGVDRDREQNWKGYGISVLVFSAVGMVFTYLILRLQGLLPLNPQGFACLDFMQR